MKKILLLLIGLLPLTAQCAVKSESLCFELNQASSVKFELRTYYDDANKWSGGFVKYASSGVPITLVLTDTQSEEMSPETPWQTTRTWAEVSDGKVSGEYEMMSQAGMIVSMTYTKKSNGKAYDFFMNPTIESSLEHGCQWKQ